MRRVISLRLILDSMLVIIPYLVFLLLASKDPFSVRNLISNLEPYPDSLYYLYPAWNYVKSGNFTMQSLDSGVWVNNLVPPVYTLFQIPFVLLFQDVRGFYFGNLFALIGAMYFLQKILNELFSQNKLRKYLTCAVLLFFATNKFFYTLATLPMAENLSIFLFAIILYFSISSKKLSFLELFIWEISIILLLFIKFSNFVIVVVSFLFFVMKNYSAFKRLYFVQFISFSVFCGLLYFVWSKNIISAVDYVFAQHKIIGFSNEYFLTNFPLYLKSILGGDIAFLWWKEQIWSFQLGLLGLGGLLASLFEKKQRNFGAFLLMMIIALIVYMSRLVIADGRYIYILILPILVGVGIFIEKVTSSKTLHTKSNIFILPILFGLLIGIFQKNTQLLVWKKQIGLNLRHTETPWNYMAIENFNGYFEKETFSQPLLLTVLPVYYLDFFKNGKYEVLPLSESQEFYRAQMGQNYQKMIEKRFGAKNIEHLINILLEKNKLLYVSNAYLGNSSSWRTDFENLQEKFNINLVKSGCENTCNIYQIGVKK